MDRTTLLAVGVTLFVLGIILRGLAREHRRTLAHRKQHELANPQPDKAPVAVSHFEKHFARYANGVFVLGMILSVVSWLL
jgi:hypothetical protein